MTRYTPTQRLQRLRDLGVLFDDEWALRISQYSWRITPRGYVEASSYFADEPKTIKLHRLVMDALDHPEAIDHINRNPLDNRVCNLRFASNSTNIRNTQRVEEAKHIRFHKGYYELRMSIDNVKYNQTFKTLEDAENVKREILDRHYNATSDTRRLGAGT